VPRTGLEPAHPFGRYHLKVVRLPISPPGQRKSVFQRATNVKRIANFNNLQRQTNDIL
jgi:hypothetical protein